MGWTVACGGLDENSFPPSAWMRFWKPRTGSEQLVLCLQNGSVSLRTNTCGERGRITAAVWQIRNRTGPSFLRSRRKMQMNNTSFFKKLLRFSLETYFLSAREVRLVEEICSWDCCHGYRVFFFLIYTKVRFPFVSSNKSGSTTERNGPRLQSDRAQSVQPSWGLIFIIKSAFYKCKSHF